MAINFCHVRHRAVLVCNKISADNYEPSNLASDDNACKHRGFLGASFITPPVDIIVQFPYTIDVSHVVLQLQNGSQRTVSFKLYTDSTNINNKGHRTNNCHLIAKCDDLIVSKVCLVNSCYKPKDLASKFSCTLPTDAKVYPMRAGYVGRINSMKISLIRTANSSVPVLSKLEIWGQPGQDCDTKMRDEILQTELRLRERIKEYEKEDAIPVSSDVSDDVSILEEDVVDVPSEFQDALTCELMSQPILLPSGNNIDRLTLDQHIKTSSVRGKLPEDPFTGVPFSKSSQPIPNIDLKTRIDEFWLKRPSVCSGGRCTGVTSIVKFNQDFPIQKTIARNTDEMFPLLQKQTDIPLCNKTTVFSEKTIITSSLYKPPRKQCKWTLSSSSAERSIESACSLKSSLPEVLKGCPTSLIQSKAQKTTGRNTDETSLLLRRQTDIPLCNKTTDFPEKMIATSSLCKPLRKKSKWTSSSSSVEHSIELSCSLKSSLQDVLKGRPTFLIQSKDTAYSNINKCFYCQEIPLRETYILPCSHLLCRKCLLIVKQLDNLECKSCRSHFKCSDVVRHHL